MCLLMKIILDSKIRYQNWFIDKNDFWIWKVGMQMGLLIETILDLDIGYENGFIDGSDFGFEN